MGDHPVNDVPYRLIDGVSFGENVVVYPFTNLYGCTIGDNTRIGPFVEIQRGARIGAGCKIQSHAFICTGVEIEDEVFVGHGVLFINDKYPRDASGDWELAVPDGRGARSVTRVRRGDSRRVSASAVVRWSAQAPSSHTTSCLVIRSSATPLGQRRARGRPTLAFNP